MMLEVDLSGAEFVIVAHLTRDAAMLDIVKQKKSPHEVTAARMGGISEDLVRADNKLVKGLSNPEEIHAIRKEKLPQIFDSRFLPRTQSLREASKRCVHSGNYDIGFKEFALKFEMPEREAKQRLDLYHHAYPGIRKWHSATQEQLRKTRTLTNCLGRKVYFMGQVGNDMFKQAYACVPQSTVVDSVNQSMSAWMNDNSDDFVPSQLLAQVHDSNLFDYPSTDFPAMARFAIRQGLTYMRPVLDYGEPFQLDVTLKAGMTWGSGEEVELTEDVGKLAAALESVYKRQNER